ncbi:MAG: DUF1232 domain-containing protein [Alphaproteobacteria bacterium]|nr:DUF1232 domain-containing protein [Alphaproteobacteria bacterium]
MMMMMPDTDNDEEEQVTSGLIDKVRHTLGRVPFAEQALAAWCCATDTATPKHVKAILVGALAYFIMPLDTIPDIIAGLGFTDDAAIFWLAWNRVNAHVTTQHMDDAKRLLTRLSGEDKP